MVPILNLAMWAPNSIEELWYTVTEPITACGLKTEAFLDGDISETYHSTDSLYELMLDP